MLAGPRSTIAKARKLRRHMSWPEVILWRRLRLRPGGLKFRRQHPAGPYVLDFFCAQANVAIEIDGVAHDLAERPQQDLERDRWLRARGVETIRIAAGDVAKDPDGVIESLISMCSSRAEPLHRSAAPNGPPPRAGEETR